MIMATIVIAACNTKNNNQATVETGYSSPDTSDVTNDFYDNTETYELRPVNIEIDGEISNPGVIDLSKLPLRSVIVKEALLDSSGDNRFEGAYRYDGYSLFDILNNVVIKKRNEGEFNPIIDMYVEVINNNGDKSVFSWGEIYYPNTLHRIIVASRVSRIVPSRSKDLWPLPAESKIIAGGDLITERNISHPVRITVKSFPKSFPVTRGTTLLYSDSFMLFRNDARIATLSPVDVPESVHYETIFYGRGRGIHSTSPFYGLLLKDIIQGYYPFEKASLKSGLLCIAGKDGYRCTVTYSELFNRNDQQEFLLVRTEKDEDGGLFRVFPASDFFSDRAVKSLSEIDFMLL